VFAHETPEQVYRGIAGVMVEAYEREPGWWSLLPEFGAYAANDPLLRERLRTTRERFLEAAAELIDALAAHHGVTFRLSAHEIARGSGALMRGMTFEWVVDPAAERLDAFEELHTAYMKGLEW
jgi:hypothetical protein